MLPFPEIDPIIFSIGPLHIRWYGLMYIIGFIAAYILVARQARQFQWQKMLDHLDNLNLSLILGVILGGRLGYVTFYNPGYYIEHPGQILATWQGGMSFHGGCLGALAAGWFYCRRHSLDFWKGADLYVVTIPIGLFLGRIGNFINGELYGRVSTLPWSMVFPSGGPAPRHPSQLYEAALEGLLLFIILWSTKAKPWQASSKWPHGAMLALFLSGYGIFRIFVEFFREPDPQLGKVALGLTMGQCLSCAMVIGGVLLWIQRGKKKAAHLATKGAA